MALPPSRSSRRWVERKAYLMIFSLVGFWIIAVFGFVFHGMDEKNSAPQRMAAPPRVADPPKQPHALLRARAPQIVRHPIDLPKYMSPLLIFTCKRADYLKQTLSQVLDYIPKTCKIGCPIIVSQDGYNQEITALIKDFQTRYESVVPIVHLQHEPAEVTGSYKKLAMHYSWALAQTFGGIPSYEYPQPDRLIILEEDLHISPDFFDYFAHMAPILDQDSSLLTVSAFNDNGNEGKVKDATRVLRSDFFPGLGWMMTRKLWDTELSTKWPGGYWDDWLREPQQRQGRHIVRPEVCFQIHSVYAERLEINALSLYRCQELFISGRRAVPVATSLATSSAKSTSIRKKSIGRQSISPTSKGVPLIALIFQ